MMHQALDDSDQTRKYGISESIIQAFIMTLLQTEAAFTLAHGHGSSAGPTVYTHVARTRKIQDPVIIIRVRVNCAGEGKAGERV